MERKNLLPLFLLTLTLWTVGCAPGSSTGEVCSGNQCSEATLNAPLDNQDGATTPQFQDELSSVAVTKGHYSHIDPTNLVPDRALELALRQFDGRFNGIRNQRWMAIADMSQKSSKPRLFLIDMVSGKVTRYHVAHGKGSDLDGDGYATKFSNVENSQATSIGAYLTAETYIGSHGYSMRLDGLESTNNNARARAVVVHPADYVSESSSYAGRSWGCPAMDPSYSRSFIDKMKNGALYYIYYNQ